MIRTTMLAVSLALVAGAAQAATISTGSLKGDFYLSCSVSNVGTKDAKIKSIKLFDDAGIEFDTSSDTCGTLSGTKVLGPKKTCAIVLAGETNIGHCEVEGSGSLRVSIQGFGQDGVLTGALPGSK